ncbi:hypothetical protein ACQKP3_19125 [Vibrio sp. DNB22_10_4]
MDSKLNLLAKAGVISDTAYNGGLHAQNLLAQRWPQMVGSEQLDMLLIHLCRAVDRVISHQPMTKSIDEDIWSEIREVPDYQALSELNNEILLGFGIHSVPEAELSYLMANLVGLNMAKEGSLL